MMNWFWWAVAIVSLIIEIATPGNIICIWFSFGGIVAGIMQLLSLDLIWQIFGFSVVSLFSMFIIRPLVKTYLQGNIVATNSDRFIGRVVTLEESCSLELWGSVQINGQKWSCISKTDAVIASGSKVRITAIEGVKFIVEKIEKEKNNG
jgi:membrane protein implicated in regulation of membrane protease activity